MSQRARRASQGQTLIIFALGFALFLFAVTCLVADTAFLFRWSGQVQSAAQLAAQSGADAVDPRYLYGETAPCPAPRQAQACAASIVDTSPQDRRGSLYAFQRACLQSGDQSADIERDPPRDRSLKQADDSQSPDGTECASDGCHVVAVVTRGVELPIPFPGFPSTVSVRGVYFAAPVVGATAAETVCAGGGWLPGPLPP